MSDHGNKGAMNIGDGNRQFAGETKFGKSEWQVAPHEGKAEKNAGGKITHGGDNSGIMNIGNGNFQTAGKTDFGESKWTLGK